MKKRYITIFICDEDLDLMSKYTPLTLSHIIDASKGRVSYIGEHFNLIYGKKFKFDVSTSSLMRSYKKLIRELMITSAFYYQPYYMVYECLDRVAAHMLYHI